VVANKNTITQNTPATVGRNIVNLYGLQVLFGAGKVSFALMGKKETNNHLCPAKKHI
jgi:hypothetical protein